MPITVQVDVREAVATLKKEFSRLTPAEFNKATAVALNETITQARTQIKRDIMGRYNITSAFLTNKTLQIDRARPGRLYADLNISTANVPLISFKATKVTTATVASAVTFRTLKSGRVKAVKGGKVKAGGVQVSVVKGRTSFIRGAFIINAKHGANVAHRAFLNGGHAYSGGAFQFRNKRENKQGNDTPVGSMLSLSPFVAGTSQEVQRRLNGFLMPKFEERMIATIERMFPGK